ncbi:MAG TPA: PLP-dependent aminotransferase family protein [Steroidobacteraceae bacterium]|nr:PLP-dependent aminotransferase family protein [Steroidobacteraceae bacterium]
MSKTAATITITLGPRAAGATLLRWLYDEIRLAIVEGRLSPGARLPSTRSIARRYGVARGTVVAAFDHLIAEGYVEGSVGSGTFVRQMATMSPTAPAITRGRPRTVVAVPSLSVRGQRLANNPFPLRPNKEPHTFRLDHAALEAFPIKTWSRITARCLRTAVPDLLKHGDTLGFAPLRAAIAHYVGLTRGVHCTPGQVVITSGTQSSLDLIARLVLDPRDRAWVEDPCYSAISSLLRGSGVEVIGVPVDEAGIDCEAGRRRARLAKLACVTPGCHFPLGMTLSLQRRLALLEWAREVGAWIFEDDYDSQLGFSGRPLAALQSLDRTGCVIYSNSFSKMLFPSLRLGFLVVPQTLLGAVEAARSVLQRFPAGLDQAVLAEFIAAGHMEQHMRRMRDLYTMRHETLLRVAKRELADVLQLSPVTAGLQTVGWLAEGIPELEAGRIAGEHGIVALPLSKLTIERAMPPAVVLGAAATDPKGIRRGIEQLGTILRGLKAKSSAAGSRPPGSTERVELQ